MITRDDTGAIVLIETPTATMRLSRTGAWFFVLDDGEGGQIRGRFDQPELGVSAWHKPAEQPVDAPEPAELPDNVLKLEHKR